jgi:hypothetical protein
MTYKYSDKFNLTSLTDILLPVPPISDLYANSMFTVTIRNTGSSEAVITLLGRIGDLTPIVVPPTNNGIVLDRIPYDAIAGGVIARCSAPTAVWYTIIEQVRDIVPTILPNEDRLLEAKQQADRERDAYVVVFE